MKYVYLSLDMGKLKLHYIKMTKYVSPFYLS